jgi:hypothetical protein
MHRDSRLASCTYVVFRSLDHLPALFDVRGIGPVGGLSTTSLPSIRAFVVHRSMDGSPRTSSSRSSPRAS